MQSLLREIRYAARRLRRAPGFTTVVVLTLALGIGANSAIFSVVNTVLLQPLPYRAPQELVTIFHYYPSLGNLEAPVSVPGFRDYRDKTHLFQSVAVEQGWSVNLTGSGEPQRLRGSRVTAGFFPTLGVSAALGRPVVAGEDEPGHTHVVVLSDGLWRRLYGGKASAIGSTIQLDGEPYDVVGVMPPGFKDPWNREVELWSPLAFTPDQYALGNYTNESLSLTGRLLPGMTVEQARRTMASFANQLKKENPGRFAQDWQLEVKSLQEVITGRIRPALLVLLGAVGFVLLIACANVANLLLARGASRMKDVAIRTALGASRSALIGQLLTESLLLSLAGAALGLLLAYAGVQALVAIAPSNLPRVDQLGIDGNVIGFTLVIALATGTLFGLAPALQSLRNDMHGTLKEGGRGGTADRGGQLVRRALVVAEVALALALLTGAGLLLKSFARLQQVDPGFDARKVLTFGLAIPNSKYPSDTARLAFFDAVLPAIAQLPGVTAVGATSVMPFAGDWSTGSFQVEGFTPAPNANSPWGDIRIVTPGYFGALRVPLRRGRMLNDRDRAGVQLVAVVDDEFVKRFYKPGDDPVGRRLWFGASTPNDSTKYISIVGVVGHTKQEALDADSRVQLHLPYAQTLGFGINQLQIAVRTSGDPMREVGLVRSAIGSIDRDQPMSRVHDMEDLIDASMGQRRLSMILLGIFAGVALALATIGIYGVMSYSVAQRTREMGLRMALGAGRESVLRLVLRQGVMLTLIGVAIGAAGALGLTRVIASQLYSVRPWDPATLLLVSGVLLSVALAATFIPALRATRVDPIIALREE